MKDQMVKKRKHVFKDLSIIHRYGKVFINNRLKEKGINCLPPYLIMICYNEGMSQDAISKKLNIDKGTVAKRIQSMINEGYIRREVSKEDRRRYGLYSTEKGRSILPEMREIEKELEEIVFFGLNSSEKEIMERSLRQATENIMKEIKKGGMFHEENA